jgi:hypothetical protein
MTEIRNNENEVTNVGMKYKIKKFFSFFNPHNLINEIAGLGYSVSTSKILAFALGFIVAAIVAGIFLHLEIPYMILLGIGFLCCLPSLFIAYFHHNYEVRRFNNVTSYMEQLIYSFHKNQKIYDSLVDVNEINTGEIHDLTGKMIEIIDNHNDIVTNPFRKAFNYFEEHYDCSRLKTLHRYLIEVEFNGGESNNSLNMLLDDIRSWTERTLEYQANRKNVQNKVLLSTFFAMISCGFMINMIPEEYVNQIIVKPVYQIGTCIILILCLLLYTYAAKKVGISYLDNEIDKKGLGFERRASEYIANYTREVQAGVLKKPMIIKTVIFALCAAVCGYCSTLFPTLSNTFKVATIAVLLIGAFIVTDKYRKFRMYSERIRRSISKMFPEWLRNVLLYLQTDNVHMSIRKSYDACPEVLKGEVGNFIHDLEKDPIGNTPYKNFLKGYNLPQLQLSANYLYSIALFGTEDINTQLNYLVEQNHKLVLQAETQRNEDTLSIFTMLMLGPMLLAVVKLMLDLILFVSIFMTYLSGLV